MLTMMMMTVMFIFLWVSVMARLIAASLDLPAEWREKLWKKKCVAHQQALAGLAKFSRI